MTRSIYFFILLILVQISGWSQLPNYNVTNENKKIDSLKNALAAATDDSTRLGIIEYIGFNYTVLNLDSALKYTQAGLTLSKKYNYASSEVRLMVGLATIFREQGKLAESLDLLFKSLKIAEANDLTSEVARAYRRLADIYVDLENFPKAIEYLLQALKIDQGNHNKKSVGIDNITLGDAYEKMNNLDSASYYADQAFQQKDIFGPQYVYQVLGNIQLKKRNYKEAAQLFQQGLGLSQENNDFLTASDLCAGLSSLFIKLNKRDSAIFYASKGFEYGQKVSFKKGIMLSGNLLAELYDSTQPATALKYIKIAAAAKDSLFGVDNIQTIQNLVAREEAKQKELEGAQVSYRNSLKVYGLLIGLATLLIIAFILYRINKHKQKANIVLQQQKQKVETTLTELKSTQAQLIQSEKMASLGELTAGIAHEIQNPLNFVNNFSDINKELLQELKEEADKGNIEEVKAIADDVISNEEKINHHGNRAGDIVKGMLQHSRSSTGVKEPTNINELANEYLSLSYHGLRAKDKSFNATMKTDFDASLEKINIIPQDIGRVLLNLYNNAFYACTERSRSVVNEKLNAHSSVLNANYQPTVSVTTKKSDNHIIITVSDNGNGIPRNIIDKIFQPFFTTKPTGQGTGLGLSLSYDIVKAHGGQISVDSKENLGTTFTILIPNA